MYKEYRIKVEEVIHGKTSITGRPQIPGFHYSVSAETDNSYEKLASAMNKPFYEVLDEALSKLLMLLAQRDEQAIVSIVSYCVPVSDGMKRMLADKYALETPFASLTL